MSKDIVCDKKAEEVSQEKHKSRRVSIHDPYLDVWIDGDTQLSPKLAENQG